MELYALVQLKEIVFTETSWTMYTIYIYKLERCVVDHNLYWIIDSAYYSEGGKLYASCVPFIASYLKDLEPGMPYLGIVEEHSAIPYKDEL